MLLGLDQYHYSVSVSGRYHWYRFGISIADIEANTPDGCYCFVMKADIVGATDLHLSIYTEAARRSRPTTTALSPSPWTIRHNYNSNLLWPLIKHEDMKAAVAAASESGVHGAIVRSAPEMCGL